MTIQILFASLRCICNIFYKINIWQLINIWLFNGLYLQSARYSKLEKADILEMTVKHLRETQRQQMSGWYIYNHMIIQGTSFTETQLMSSCIWFSILYRTWSSNLRIDCTILLSSQLKLHIKQYIYHSRIHIDLCAFVQHYDHGLIACHDDMIIYLNFDGIIYLNFT